VKGFKTAIVYMDCDKTFAKSLYLVFLPDLQIIRDDLLLIFVDFLIFLIICVEGMRKSLNSNLY